MVFTLGVIAAPSLTADDGLPTGGSVRFPQSNALGSDAPGTYSYLRAEGLDATLFGAAGALIVQVELPWDRWNQSLSTRHFILGNDYRSTPLAGGLNLSAVADRERAVPRAIRMAASNDAQSVGITLTLDDRPARLLLALRSDGAAVELAAWADGQRIGTSMVDSGSAALSGLRLAGDRLLIGCAGSGGSATATPFADDTRLGFDGAISFIGYHAGIVTDAALSEISAGDAPEAALSTGANWILARQLDTAVLPAYGPPIWATGDTNPAWTLEGGGSGLRPGSDIVASRSGSARFGLDIIRDGQVWGAAPGTSTAPVRVAGALSGVSGPIEVRAIYPDGRVIADWTALSGLTVTGDRWSGEAALPLFSDGWGHLEARPASQPDLVQRSRAECGAGWVIGVVGQSNAEFPWKLNAGSPGAVTTGPIGNLSFCIPFRSNSTISGNAAGSGSVVMDVVTLEQPRTEGLISAAEEVRRYGNTPVMIFDMTQEGSGINQLQSDSITARQWADSPGDQLAIAGNAVSAFVIQWALQLGGQGAAAQNFDTRGVLDALIDGDTSSSAATWPISPGNFLRSSTFAHGDTTGICLMQRTGGGDTGTSRDQDLFWDRITSPDTKELDFYTSKIYAYAAEKGHAIGQDIRDSVRTGGHFDTTEGKVRVSRRVLASGLRACGIDTSENPRFAGITVKSPTELVARFSLPNGGTLQTGWGFAGETPGAGINPVQGFEVYDPTNQAGLPGDVTRSGFTTAITDAAAGEVTITKASGTWVDGTIVAWTPGQGVSYSNPTINDELWKGWLYESGAQEGGLGVPVMGMDNFEVPVDPVATLGAVFVLDPSDPTSMIQERGGDFAGGTPVSDGDPVGSIRNLGTLGGYMSAPTDGLRPIFRSIPAGSDLDVQLGKAYSDRPLNFLEFIDKELVFSEGPAIPNSSTWSMTYALRHIFVSSARRMVWSQTLETGTGDGLMLFQNTNAFNANQANRFSMKWAGSNGVRGNWPIDVGIGLDRDARFIVNSTPGTNVSRVRSDRNFSFGEFTAGTSTGTYTFKIGSSPVSAFANGRFRIYGLMIAPYLDTKLKERQAMGWIGRRHGALYPHW